VTFVSLSQPARADSQVSDNLLVRLYNCLVARYGPQHWWPAEDPLELVVGAILTQNTSWRNVEKAIASLKTAGLMSIAAIHVTPPDELARAIRSSGCQTVKAARLQAFVQHVRAHHHGNLTAMLKQSGSDLRRELLSIRGIGPETADCIVVYGGNWPSFVVDAYTRRLFERVGFLTQPSYDEAQQFCHERLPRDPRLFNEFHALIVRHSIVHCRARRRCVGCPVADWCPGFESNVD
jgi:endonuclease III related protein